MHFSIALAIVLIVPFVSLAIMAAVKHFYYRKLPIISPLDELDVSKEELKKKYPHGYHCDDGTTNSKAFIRLIELVNILYHFPMIVVGRFVFGDEIPGWFYLWLTPLLYSALILSYQVFVT